MNLRELSAMYADTSLRLANVYTITVPPGAQALDTHTQCGACGYVIPLSRCASYEIEGRVYVLQKGCIVHAGDGMALTKKVLSDVSWKYVFLHYTCVDPNFPLLRTHFSVDVSTESSTELMAIIHRLQQDFSENSTIQSMRRTGLLYEFIAAILQLVEEHERLESCRSVEPAIRMMRDNYAIPLAMKNLANLCQNP